MRILGYIPHPLLKITVFKMDTRLTVKFETANCEAAFKFRADDYLQSIDDVQRLVDAPFLAAVELMVARLEQEGAQALARVIPDKPEDFEEII